MFTLTDKKNNSCTLTAIEDYDNIGLNVILTAYLLDDNQVTNLVTLDMLGEGILMKKQPSLEYLLCVHYLKKMREQGFITYKEYNEIDRLNRITFGAGTQRTKVT